MKKTAFCALAGLGLVALATALPVGAQTSNRQTDNCVTDRIIGDGKADQTVVLTNKCDVEVEWAVCLSRSDWGWDAFKRGKIAPKQTRRLYINNIPPGGRYNYRYRWCTLNACPIDIPDC